MHTGSKSKSYKAAGVDVTAGYRAVELMKSHVQRTKIPGVLSEIGGFGGLFKPDLTGMKEPVFVSGTDGVGTKLKLAFLMDKHDTIGIDCVAMCVNDIICTGAMPLFFLDYLAVGRNIPKRVAEIVGGVADGCEMAGCALIGGETAEMPGFYAENEYDIAGFSVGIADREKLLDPKNVKDGYALIGIASSGLHSNGYSLARKVLDIDGKNVRIYARELGASIGEALLTPTKIYVKAILALLKAVRAASISNITGGGFYENIPRALPEGFGVKIERARLEIPPIFEIIQKAGDIPWCDMFATFNMGTGMCVVVPPEEAATAIKSLHASGEKAAVIGEVKRGVEGVLVL
ncbi:MAG: phosphoribosylformylglycinamidine cyclo-ligase [Oscillospiraceae bacterium]|nr:phosphoribosylformylglycinamidine cyclo-ligase [Oscillospiraceae bacterium]